MKEQELFKSGTSLKSIRNSFLGFLLFSITAVYLYLQVDIVDTTSLMLISFFGIFGIGCLLPLFWLKDLILTDKRFIINWRFFPKTKSYNLCNIKDIEEVKYEINATHRSTNYNVHRGRQATLTFRDSGKPLRFNSYETENYYILINKVKGLTKKMDASFIGDVDDHANFEQRLYGRENKFWFILTVGIIALFVFWIIKIIYVG